MSIRTLIDSVKEPLEAEKHGSRSWWDSPIIPFIPEETSSEVERDDFIEVALKADQSLSTTGTLNTVKKNVRKYSHGPIEMLLKWKMDLEKNDQGKADQGCLVQVCLRRNDSRRRSSHHFQRPEKRCMQLSTSQWSSER